MADNDAPAVRIVQSGGDTIVTEGGDSLGGRDWYEFVLTRAPLYAVAVTASASIPSRDDEENEIARGVRVYHSGERAATLLEDLDQRVSTTLTFTPSNWNTPQRVYVEAEDDSFEEGTDFVSITHTLSSPDVFKGQVSSTTPNSITLAQPGAEFNAAAGGDVDGGTEAINAGIGHQFANGQRIVYSSGGFGSIGDLIDGQSYFIVNSNPDSGWISLSDTPGGAILNLEQQLGTHRFERAGDGASITIPASSGGIDAANDSILAAHPFEDNDAVVYYNDGDGPNIEGLSDGVQYFVLKMDSERFQLSTDLSGSEQPIGIAASTQRLNAHMLTRQSDSGTFEFSGMNVTGNFTGVIDDSDRIQLGNHTLSTGDIVIYNGNGAGPDVVGLKDGGVYHVAFADATTVKLSATSGGVTVPISPAGQLPTADSGFAGMTVEIIAGAGSGQEAIIGSNTDNSITVLGQWDPDLALPDATSQFRVQGYNALPVPIVNVQVIDDDLPSVIVEQTGHDTVVAENAALTTYATDTYTLRLSKAPQASVTIELAKAITPTDPLAQLSFEIDGIAGTQVVFTPTDFGPRTITVKAIADGVREGRHFATISHTVTPGSSREYLQQAPVTSVEFEGNNSAIVDAAGNRLVIGLHGLQPNQPVVYDAGPGGTDIEGLTSGQTYYIANPVETSVQLAMVPDGRPIDITPGLTGTRHFLNPHTLMRVGSSTSTSFAAFRAVDGVADTLTLPFNVFSNGEQVVYTNNGAGNDVFGLIDGQEYHVVNSTTDTIQLALTPGGVPIDLEHDAPLSSSIEPIDVQILDGDAPGVFIRETDQSSDVVEGGASDQYAIVLTAPPARNETVTITPDVRKTLTSTTIRGVVTSATDTTLISTSMDLSTVDFTGWTLRIIEGTGNGQSRTVASHTATEITVDRSWEVGSTPDSTSVFRLQAEVDQLAIATIDTLTFNDTNWHTPQIVSISALDDDFVDGGEIKAFAPGHADLSLIRGPLTVQGGVDPDASTDIPASILLPGETDIKKSLGAVVSASNVPTVQITVINDAPFQTLLAAAGGDLTGFTIEITDGPGLGQQRLITSHVNNVISVDGAWLRQPGPLSWYTIEATNPNLLVHEPNQVDTLNVRNTASQSDDVAMLEANRLVGLGMGEDRTIGGRLLLGGITINNLEVVNLELGAGADRVFIEDTHPGDTRIDLGQGISDVLSQQTVDVRTIGGHTTILGSDADEVVNVGSLQPSMGGVVDRIGGLLTFDGMGGSDELNVDDSGDDNDNIGTLTETTLTGLDMPTRDEIQTVTVIADSGTFTLDGQTYGVTEPVPFNATAEEMLFALDDLYGPGNARVVRDDNTYTITFVGALSGIDVPDLTADVSNLRLDGAPDVLLSPVEGASFVHLVLANGDGGSFTLARTDVDPIVTTEPLIVGPTTLDFDNLETQLESELVNLFPDVQFVDVSRQDPLVRPNFYRIDFDSEVPAMVVDASQITTSRPPRVVVETQTFNWLQTVTVEADGGTFTLETGNGVTSPIPWNASADDLRRALVVSDPGAAPDQLVPLLGANNVLVEKLENVEIRRGVFGSVFNITWQGEFRGVPGQDLGRMTADTSGLDLDGSTGNVRIAVRTDGINYYNLETVNIDLGSGHDRFNVQGTLAATSINAAEGDDLLYVSSGADLGSLPAFTPTAGDLEALHNEILHNSTDESVTLAPARVGGSLDFIFELLNIEVGSGQNTLSVSDRHDPDADTDVQVTDSQISGLAPAAITYAATGGDFSGQGTWTLNDDVGLFARGINIYGGVGGNTFDVSSTHTTSLATPFDRTVTSIFSGDGNDTVTSSVTDNDRRVLVLQGWLGDDTIDASASTLPGTIFGDDGSDILRGGTNRDIIFGDSGRAYFTVPSSVPSGEAFNVVFGGEPITSHLSLLASLGTDDSFLTLDMARTVDPTVGGADHIQGTGAGDILLGGTGNDTIFGDLYVGVDGLGNLVPGSELSALVPGADIAIGDGGLVTYFNESVRIIRSIDPTMGGNDTISGDDYADILIGGFGDDQIHGEAETRLLPLITGAGSTPRGGDDVILGDNGRLDWFLASDTILDRPDVELHLGSTTVPLDTDATTLDRITITDPEHGGDDRLFGNAGRDILIGGTGRDRIHGDTDDADRGMGADGADGDDLIFGDHGKVFPTLPSLDAFFVNNYFFATHTAESDGGNNDTIFANGADDTVLGQQGDDLIFGGLGNDDLIGGHNVVGGHDELDDMDPALATAILSGELADMDALDINDVNDVIDAGGQDDVVAGDNAIIIRQADSLSDRYRQLSSSAIYTINTANVNGETVDVSFAPNVGTAAELKPDSVLGRTVIVLDHTRSIELAAAAAPTDPRVFGNDVLAGGANDDEIFGQLGDDILQGDGAVLLVDGSPVVFNPSPATTASFTVPDDQMLGTHFQIDGLNLLYSVAEATTDGDDYLEGNSGSDRIYGGLGQDDIIGGSSMYFGLDSETAVLFGYPTTVSELRFDGADAIYGGAGDSSRMARNAAIDPAVGDAFIAGDERHGRDADTIAGDNANVYRLVDAENNYLAFNYDIITSLQGLADGYSLTRPLVPRAVELLDYGYTVTPTSLTFDASSLGTDDLIHGESGDDVIFAMTGNDVIFGEGGDDDIYGQHGYDRVFGGSGEDGIVTDEGLIFTSRNGKTEPLHQVNVVNREQTYSLPGPFTGVVEFITGRLTKQVELIGRDAGLNDVAYGGLGDDFIHLGDGDDAASGAEALPAFYVESRVTDFDPLQYDATTTIFAAYDPNNPRLKIPDFLLNFESVDATGMKVEDGKDRIFGDNGNDWLVGGTGPDRLFVGLGDDLMNLDDNQDNGTSPTFNDLPDAPEFADGDFAFGGNGRDVMIGNTGNDRMFDWAGEFNSYFVPYSAFGDPDVTRKSNPQIRQFLLDLGASSGADVSLVEPNGELGLSTKGDRGKSRDPQPGNISGVRQDTQGGPEDDRGVVPTIAGSTPGNGGQIMGTNQATGSSLDVNLDGYISPWDALQIINNLNSNGMQDLAEGEPQDERPNHHLDVNRDMIISPYDALLVINHLNSVGVAEGEAEGEAGVWRVSAGTDPAGPSFQPHSDAAGIEDNLAGVGPLASSEPEGNFGTLRESVFQTRQRETLRSVRSIHDAAWASYFEMPADDPMTDERVTALVAQGVQETRQEELEGALYTGRSLRSKAVDDILDELF